MLTRAEIDDILKLIDGSEFTELRLELCKGCTAQPFHLGPNTQSGMQASRDAGGSQPWTPAPPAAVAAPIIASGDGSESPAPLLGTFWHAPRPGADPYLQPGDPVTADTIIDTTLCDGNRSNWGVAGLDTAMMQGISPAMKRAGFEAIDFTTSTHMAVAVRYSKQDPWQLLRLFRAAAPETRLLFRTTGMRFISWETASHEMMAFAFRLLVNNGLTALR